MNIEIFKTRVESKLQKRMLLSRHDDRMSFSIRLRHEENPYKNYYYWSYNKFYKYLTHRWFRYTFYELLDYNLQNVIALYAELKYCDVEYKIKITDENIDKAIEVLLSEEKFNQYLRDEIVLEDDDYSFCDFDPLT